MASVSPSGWKWAQQAQAYFARRKNNVPHLQANIRFGPLSRCGERDGRRNWFQSTLCCVSPNEKVYSDPGYSQRALRRRPREAPRRPALPGIPGEDRIEVGVARNGDSLSFKLRHAGEALY